MVNVSALIFSVTITFSPFAGLIAYIIMFEEYKHHLDKKTARQQAIHMAIFTFLAFVAVGLISGFAFNQFVNH